jgi:hypothetical protein
MLYLFKKCLQKSLSSEAIETVLRFSQNSEKASLPYEAQNTLL